MSIGKNLPYQLIVFNEVIKLGSFTAAAHSLGHSNATITQYIHQLESELKVKLIDRNTRKISATKMGEKIYATSQSIVDCCHTVKADVEHLIHDYCAHVRVSMPHAFQEFIAPNTLGILKEAQPSLEVEIVFSDTYLELTTKKMDLAISIGERDNADDKVILMNTLKNILVASASYIEKNNEITMASLSAHTFIELPWQSRVNPITGKENLTIERCKKMHVNTVTAAISYASQGLGIALLPSMFVHEQIQKKNLVQVLKGQVEVDRNIYAIHRYDYSMPLSIKLILDTINASINLQNHSI